MAELVSSRAWEASQLIGASLDPENEAWTPADLVAAAVALKEAATKVAEVARDADKIAADSLDGGTVVVGERKWRAGTTDKKDWAPENVERLRDEMSRNVARKVALDPITGELDSDRARVAQQTLSEFNVWQSINPKSFKKGAMDAAGLKADDFCQVTRVATLREVPQ